MVIFHHGAREGASAQGLKFRPGFSRSIIRWPHRDSSRLASFSLSLGNLRGVDYTKPVPHQRRLSCLSPREAGFATLVLAFLCSLGFYGCGKTDQAAVRGSGSASVGGTSEPVPITNMVRIKPGTFFRIKYTVTLTREFWIAKYEVTQAEYWTLMSKNPSYFTNEVECPVERVNYLEATAYCEPLTHREREAGHLPANYLYRLPTEAEWEYACRAGTTNFYSFGEATTEAAEYAWTMEDSE